MMHADTSETTQSLIQFLIKDLAVSPDSIVLALQYSEQLPNLLPIVLWQYGFINLSELERTFDWLCDSTSVL